MKGNEITVVYNGKKVVEADISKNADMQKRPMKGYIGLQNHGTGVEFRRVEIKVLDQ